MTIHPQSSPTSFINPLAIERNLSAHANPSPARVRDILTKAKALAGLDESETAALIQTRDVELIHEILDSARHVKDTIYGKRLVLFAPLYYSNHCRNNCLYCGFRADNHQSRRRLSLSEVERETKSLIRQGHKRVLVIAGEESGDRAFDYLIDVIRTVYSVREGRGEIRRVNVEMAPMTVDQFHRLRDERLGTYVVFQETYHPETYTRMHPSGPKADYLNRLTVMDRAMKAGIHDVGIGALFGLHDWRFEVLSLLAHARHLESTFGAGPHTISVPRIEYADNAPAAKDPPAPVSDHDFRKLVAILRLAVPYTGIILSTRESPSMRRDLLGLGVSQLSAGSKTDPGGYSEADSVAQFAVGDHRTLEEVIADIASHGYVPSFCTGCYRKGRTGRDFMELAKPGLIRSHCLPNALITFKEYLNDYASSVTRALGEDVIRAQLINEVAESDRITVSESLDRVDRGVRDIYF